METIQTLDTATAQELFAGAKYKEACQLYNQYAQGYEKDEQWELLIEANIGVTKCHTRLGQFKNAIQKGLDNMAIAENRLTVYHHLKIDVYITLIEVYAYDNQYSVGEECLQKAMSFLEKHHPDRREYRKELYNAYGHYTSAKGKYNDSINYYYKSISLYVEEGEFFSIETALLYNNIATPYFAKGNYQKSLAYLQKALVVREKLLPPNHPDLAVCFQNISVCLGKMGDHNKEILFCFKAIDIYIKAYGELHPSTSTAYHNLATAFGNMEDFEKGIEYGKKALSIRLEVFDKNHQHIAYTYDSLGSGYRGIGNFKKAISFYNKSLEIYQSLFSEKHPRIARVLENIGTCFYLYGKNEDAHSYFKKALQINQKNLGEKNDNTAINWHLIGGVYSQKKAFIKALECYQKALIGFFVDYQETDVLSFPDIHTLCNSNYAYRTLMQKSKVLTAYYENCKIEKYLISAQNHVNAGIAFVRKIAQSYTSGTKLWWSAKVMTSFELAIELHTSYSHLDSTNPNKAFEFSEKSKAFLLLSNLQDSQAKYEAAIPQNLLEQEYDLKVELNYLSQRIQQLKAKEVAEKKLLEVQSEYFDYHQAYQKLIQQFEKKYPEYHRLKYDIQTVDVETLQRNLSSNQLLIEYFIGEKHLYIFGITQNGFEVLQQEKPSNFNQLIKAFNKVLNRALFQKYAQAAHELYQILLAPILQHPSFNKNRTTQQLILIPHDILSAFPFEALLCSLPKEKTNLQYADLDYLLSHYDVVYHYSATLWWQGQKDGRKSGLEDSFVGFAPVYQESEPQEETNEFLERQKETKELSTKHPRDQKELAGMRSVTIGGNQYQALLYSEKEVKGIQAAFEAKRLPQCAFLHEQATKTNFEAAVKGKKYVLIAAHGFYNKNQPELSGIIFSPENVEESEEAVLYVNDAYHLDLKQTDLVVLSACESGIGKLAKGEGMMAVNRGFLYSGANNVIFTLFKVYDEQSSQLTQALFRYILEGKMYSQALRLAKLELIQSGQMDPKAWAGFVMIGGGS